MSNCPIDYRYAPEVLKRAPEVRAETAYVVGGLYGNVEALRTILHMARHEERQGRPVRLLFNGDFHWFDVLREDFQAIQEGVLPHRAMQGNVETELARPGTREDCGCDYPDYVDRGVVERSNRIFGRLKQTAMAIPGAADSLGRLPKYGVLEVAGRRIGVLHGDAHSLAGWSYAAEALGPGQGSGADCAGSAAVPQTAEASLAADFHAAGVLAFATTHTCLPVLQGFPADGGTRVLINNGSAGMANFRGMTFGLITRISAHPHVPEDSLYGTAVEGVRFDALPVRFDPVAWQRRFLAAWPAGSPAHESYFARIVNGPAWEVRDAMRLKNN